MYIIRMDAHHLKSYTRYSSNTPNIHMNREDYFVLT